MLLRGGLTGNLFLVSKTVLCLAAFCAQVATAAIAEGAVGYVVALILEYRFVLLRSIGNYELFTATTAPGDLS